jgi:hypothetical protein
MLQRADRVLSENSAQLVETLVVGHGRIGE